VNDGIFKRWFGELIISSNALDLWHQSPPANDRTWKNKTAPCSSVYYHFISLLLIDSLFCRIQSNRNKHIKSIPSSPDVIWLVNFSLMVRMSLFISLKSSLVLSENKALCISLSWSTIKSIHANKRVMFYQDNLANSAHSCHHVTKRIKRARQNEHRRSKWGKDNESLWSFRVAKYNIWVMYNHNSNSRLSYTFRGVSRASEVASTV